MIKTKNIFVVVLVFFNVFIGVLHIVFNSPTLLLILVWVFVLCFIFYVFLFKNKCATETSDALFQKKEVLTITETLGEGLVVYSPQFKILVFNRAAEEIFSLTKKGVVGQYIEPKFGQIEKFKTLTQIIFPSLASSISQLSDVDVWPQITEIFTDEQNRKFYTILNKITDNQGKPLCFIKLIKDETREHAILQSKNEFINTAAHQLRTPLTTLNWAIENILKLSEGNLQDIHDIAAEAIKVSERTLKITNDLLDVAKIEEGKFGYSFKNVDIIYFIKGIIDTIIPFANQRSVRVTFSHENINELYLSIDPDKLGIALFNLIDNAIKYNATGGLVSVVLETAGAGDFYKISVQDSGVGIPEDEKEKIFKKFYRATNAAQLEPNGNGLGLFITKNIIKKHGGEIGFESYTGRGTTFWFTLPTKTITTEDLPGFSFNKLS